MFFHPRYEGKIDAATETDHELVVVQNIRPRLEARSQTDSLPSDVDELDVAHIDPRRLQQPPNGSHAVLQFDRSADHLGEQRLEDHVIHVADQHHFDVAPIGRRHAPLQLHRRVNAGKPAAEDHDAMFAGE